MGRKKSVKKPLPTEEKENIDQDYHDQLNNSTLKDRVLNDDNSSAVLMNNNMIEQQSSNPEVVLGPSNEDTSTNNEINQVLFADISNLNDQHRIDVQHSITTNIDAQDGQHIAGQKRSFDNDLENELVRVKKRCTELEKRVASLELIWLQCSEQVDEIENVFDSILIECTNNDTNRIAESTAQSVGVSDIDDATLQTLTKKSATSTARSLVKFFFKNHSGDMKLADVNKELIQWIVEYSKRAHPNDSSSSSKIRHAMANVFALAKLKQKRFIRN